VTVTVTDDTITIERPKRSRLARLLADSDLDWRAEQCTKLLVEGYTNIRVDGEKITATKNAARSG
jgi:hypothetical protein